MDLHHLEYIVEIANEQNISKAAERLHISQPTLSIFLNKLEKDLKIQLFRRSNNKFTITEDGKKYVDACVQILEIRDKLYDNLYTKEYNNIRVGVLSSNAPVFNSVFYKFRAQYPDITITPIIQKSNEIYDSLIDGKIDIGFVTSYLENLDAQFTRVKYKVIKEYEIMLCISKNNPAYSQLDLSNGYLLKKDYSILDKLSVIIADVPMIKKRILNDIIPGLGIESPQLVGNPVNLEFLTATLSLENYYCFLPYSHFPDEIAAIPLESHPKVKKLLIYDKNKFLNSIEKDFIRLTDETFAEFPYYYNL